MITNNMTPDKKQRPNCCRQGVVEAAIVVDNNVVIRARSFLRTETD